MTAWKVFIAINLFSVLVQPSNTKLILACLFFPSDWKHGLTSWIVALVFGFLSYKICQWIVG